MGAHVLVPAGVQGFPVSADLALQLLCRHGGVSGATGKRNYQGYDGSIFWEADLQDLARVPKKMLLFVAVSII